MPLFFSSKSVCDRPWILSLCSVCRAPPPHPLLPLLYSFLPSSSFLFGKEGLRLRWRQHWWGGGGGSDGGGGGEEKVEGGVTCWTTFLCSCGGWWRMGVEGRAGSSLHCGASWMVYCSLVGSVHVSVPQLQDEMWCKKSDMRDRRLKKKRFFKCTQSQNWGQRLKERMFTSQVQGDVHPRSVTGMTKMLAGTMMAFMLQLYEQFVPQSFVPTCCLGIRLHPIWNSSLQKTEPLVSVFLLLFFSVAHFEHLPLWTCSTTSCVRWSRTGKRSGPDEHRWPARSGVFSSFFNQTRAIKQELIVVWMRGCRQLDFRTATQKNTQRHTIPKCSFRNCVISP